MYQTTKTNKKLIPALRGCPHQKFVYYGCGEEKIEGNIHYKPFCTEAFISDLASTKAVITNGGFTLISEAIYLHKPILCNPIEKHYEQFLNAEMVTKMGYGASTTDISPEEIETFIAEIPQYQQHLSGYKQSGNEALFGRIDTLLA